jgi:hypothetical protein
MSFILELYFSHPLGLLIIDDCANVLIFMFDCDSKEKEHQNTWQSDLYSGPPRTIQKA